MRSALNGSVAALLLLALAGCSSSEEQPYGTVGADVSSNRARQVSVERASIGPVLALPGAVVASPEFDVLASSSGRVSLGVRKGDRVKRGQVVAEVDGRPVTTPVDGWVLETLVPSDAVVAANLPLVRLKSSSFAINATVPMAEVYRVYTGAVESRAEIDNGPGPFDCDLLATAGAMEEGAGRSFLCAVPTQLRVFEGMTATLAVSFATREKVPALPVGAVAGSAETGSVYVVRADGTTHEQHVRLGVSDGSMIEIKSGLKLGQRVLAEAPLLRHSTE